MLSDSAYPGTFLPYWYAFLTGAVTFWYLRNGGWSGLFLLAGSLLLLVRNDYSEHWFAPVTVMTCAVIVLAAKTGKLTQWLNYRWFQACGAWSYPFFLLHVPVTTLYLGLSRRFLYGNLPLELANLSLAVVINLAVAALVYRYIDEPSIRLSRLVSLKATQPLPSV